MLVLTFLLALCAGALVMKWLRVALIKNQVPVLSGWIPLIGHEHLLLGDSKHVWNVVKKLSMETLSKGGVTTLLSPLGRNSVYAVADPEDFATVSNKCLEKYKIYDFMKPWVGNGLFTAKAPLWKQHRKLLNPAFSQPVLNSFIEVFNKQGRKLVNELATEVGKGTFDPDIYLVINNLETICNTELKVDIDEHKTLIDNYLLAAKDIMAIFYERFQKSWKRNSYLYSWTKVKRKQDAVVSQLHKLSNFILQTKKSEWTKNSAEGKIRPLLDLLMDLGKTTDLFPDTTIREEIDTIIFGGHDTSVTVLIYTLILLGSHPNVQERVYSELQEFLEGSDRDLEKHDLPKLVYLEAVLKESMRLYPIGPVLTRSVHENVKLKNCTIPAGCCCLLLIWGLHRHASWGTDAGVFRPDRWLDPTTLPANPNVFAPFGIGKRGCIGRVYAMMSMKITLAHVLRRYRVSSDVTKLQLKIDTLLKPVSGHHISIEERMSHECNSAEYNINRK